MKDAKQYPVPKTLTCPYCGGEADQGLMRPDTGDVVFSHYVKESKLVGRETRVTLHTHHVFAVAWDGDEWKHAPEARLNCPKIREKVGLKRPQYTDIAYTAWVVLRGGE
jgi:hypothetical protein